MKLSKKLLVSLTFLTVFAYVPTAYSFGLGNLVGGVGGGGGASADPDAFLKNANDARDLMQASLGHMTNALLSKDKAAEFKRQQDSANSITDPAEREAKNSEILKSEAAAVNEQLSNSDSKKKIDAMDAKHKASLGASAFNFALALLKDKALAEQSSGLISSMTSPSNLSKIGRVKDAASSLSSQISIAADLAGKMPAVFSAVGVQAPASVDAKPAKVTEGD
jgi:hypothetical protein